MGRLTAGFFLSIVALAGSVHAQGAPPRYRASCPTCPLVVPFGSTTLEAFADHTRHAGDARLAEELIAAQTRAERIGTGGILAGLAVAAGGLLFLPQRCPDLAVAQEPICEIGRPHVALMTAGATLAVMGTVYLALSLPSAEELVARVNVWNRARPDAPWRLTASRAPASDSATSVNADRERALSEQDMEIISRRRSGSRWLEPKVYLPMMIGASCAAAGAWFLAGALDYLADRRTPEFDPNPLGGRIEPRQIDLVPGLVAGTCTALSLGTALFMAFERGPSPHGVTLAFALGAVGLAATFQ